jgi:Protein of unknown function (DUF3300)
MWGTRGVVSALGKRPPRNAAARKHKSETPSGGVTAAGRGASHGSEVVVAQQLRLLSKICSVCVALVLSFTMGAQGALGQEAPPTYTPEQLNYLVARIALYPDPLLAQILTVSTFPDQIPDAAKWADEHHYMAGEELAQAISSDQLPWDPSVQALLPFPSVLGTMASDIKWTTDLGNAVLGERGAVMDAVQRQRHKAARYGYLRFGGPIIVTGTTYIEIAPTNPAYIVVPVYDPAVVFAPPRPGFVVGAAIEFGFGVMIGTWFHPWGWGATRFVWADHAVFINNVRWERTWANRHTYVHPYPGIHHYAVNARVEHHELLSRSAAERAAPHEGHPMHEEHGGQHGGH